MIVPSQDEIPCFQVSTEEVPGPMALEAFRQSVQDVFALSRPSDADEDYRLHLIAWHLGTMMLGSFRSSALDFDRPAALVGTSGLDHVLVQLYVEGGFTGVADDLPIIVRPGDIVIFDLTRTLRTRASDFGNISLLVPRAFFASANLEVAGLHGLVLASDAGFTAVLSSYIVALAERIPALKADEADIAAKATAALVTTMLARQEDRSLGAPTAIQSPFRRIAAEIDQRLRMPDLDAASLAKVLGMSRATLYRVFEPVGGIADYIRQRRLSLAAVAMSLPENRRRKIAEIAFECGFASESAFNRAFKAAFGMPPGEARNQGGRLRASPEGEDSVPHGSSDFARWMRTLRA